MMMFHGLVLKMGIGMHTLNDNILLLKGGMLLQMQHYKMMEENGVASKRLRFLPLMMGMIYHWWSFMSGNKRPLLTNPNQNRMKAYCRASWHHSASLLWVRQH